ncbi:proton-conducting transporter membrane subunit, partial [uncultured Thalassolituus sp.]|uniref:proton-conducting transporter transmembrane domain-containing protein n=1 Tax=uncultured Thalassolituus sp. TaxID=285273 RepID=UPI0035A64DBE
MAMRPQTMPDDDIRLTIDQSAGIDLPAIYEIEWRVSGAAARTYQAVALLDDSDMRTDRIEATIGSLLGSNHPTSVDVTYDEASGIAVVTGRGLVERYEVEESYQLVSAALFLCVGVVYDRVHSRQIASYGGLVHRMPRYAAVFMLFILASVGLPGTSGFVGEFLVILTAFKANVWYAILAGMTLILGAA